MTKKEENTEENKPKEELKVLFDLVQASNKDILSITMDLSKHELLDQYYYERKLKQKGIPLNPSITEAEFKKIIGD